MASERLTDDGIKRLKPKNDRYEVSDSGSGLVVRVWPHGAKRYGARVRTPAGQRRIDLGAVGEISLAKARRDAEKVRLAGADPHAETRAIRAATKARRQAAKVSDILDAFLADQGPRLKPATLAGWSRYIKVDIVPELGKLVPAEVTDETIAGWLEKLKKKRGPVSVARAYEVLRRAWRWARATRRVKVNPFDGLEAGELVAKAKTSTRVFDDDELLGILAGAGVTELRLLIPFVLLTGARQGEARGARWDEIDLRERIWTVPAKRSKTGEPHRVPLSEGVLAVLDECDRRRPYCFPAPTKAGHLVVNSSALEKVRRVSGVSDFNLHHLRRTVRQRMTDAGVLREVAEAVLGHLPPKIVRVYSPQWEPIPAMRTALEAWSREMMRIASGRARAANVVEFSATR